MLEQKPSCPGSGSVRSTPQVFLESEYLTAQQFYFFLCTIKTSLMWVHMETWLKMFMIQMVVIAKSGRQYASTGEWRGNWFMNIMEFHMTEIMNQIT